MTGLVVSYGVSRVYVVGALSYRPPGVPMKARFISGIVIGLALTLSASAQDAPAAPPAGSPSASPAQGAGPGGGQGGQGQRGGGRGGWGGGGMMGMGGGLMGTVTEAAADHFTIKTDAGEAYTVHFSVNTRMMKQGAGMRDRGERGQAGQNGQAGQARQGGEGGERGQGMGAGGGNPPQPIKPTDIKVGDAIAAMGEIDAAAKSVGATAILQIDPERAKQMREMQANYGKTWLMGKVTAIDGVKVTLMASAANRSPWRISRQATSCAWRELSRMAHSWQPRSTIWAHRASRPQFLVTPRSHPSQNSSPRGGKISIPTLSASLPESVGSVRF